MSKRVSQDTSNTVDTNEQSIKLNKYDSCQDKRKSQKTNEIQVRKIQRCTENFRNFIR